MEFLGMIMVVIVFIFAFLYVLIKTKDSDLTYAEQIEKQKKELATKKELDELKKQEDNMNLIGQKMFDAREKLKKSKFLIDDEEISPIEIIGKNQYIKMICFDNTSKKMAIVSIIQTAKEPLINYYDIDNVIKCELEVNDKEVYVGEEEVDYELKSIKIKVQRHDIINPEYTIGLLPKLINNPNMVFRKDYFDFAREVQKHILKNKIK